jgi:hypothetical protein
MVPLLLIPAGFVLLYLCCRPRALLYAWLATIGIQLDFTSFHLGLADVLAAPLGLWGIALALRRPPKANSVVGRLLVFCGIFFTVGHLTAAFELGTITPWTLFNKDLGLVEMLLCVLGIVTIVDSLSCLKSACLALVLGGSILNLLGMTWAAFLLLQGITSNPILYAGVRYSGFLPDPNAWAGYLAVIASFQLAALACESRWRLWQWCNLAALFFGIAWSLSRTGLLALLSGVLAFLVFASREQRRRLAPVFLPGSLLLALMLWVSGIATSIGERNEDRADNGRIELTQHALQMYGASPVSLLSGIGIGTFLDKGHDLQIHNTSLWILVEGGPLLFIALLVTAWSAARRTRRAMRCPELRPYALAILCSQASCLVLSLGVEALYQRELWLLLALPDAIVAISGRWHRLSATLTSFYPFTLSEPNES